MECGRSRAGRGKLGQGSWADGLPDAVDRGEVDQAVCPMMMIDYVGHSLDTTIYAIGSGVWLFAKHPEEWEKVRESPSRIPAAINEILRMEPPIQSFSRLLTRDHNMNEIPLPPGSPATVFYSPPNRHYHK